MRIGATLLALVLLTGATTWADIAQPDGTFERRRR